MSVRETPTFYVFDEINSINQTLSTVSSQAKNLASDVPLSNFLQLESTFDAQSTVISSLEVIQDEYFFVSTYFYTNISSRLSLVEQAGYLSSLSVLYFGGSTFASSMNAQNLIIGTGTVTGVTTSIGSNNTATADYGLVVGQLNTMGAIGAVTSGYGNIITGAYSHADASQSEITGEYSHIDGGTNSNYASYAHIDGFRNKISSLSDGGHAEGRGNLVANNISSGHAEGYVTVTLGNYGHSEGSLTSSIGLASHAEGFDTRAQGSNSHAEGQFTTAKGVASHTEGFSTVVEVGNYSHGEGQSNRIFAENAHAEGFQNTVTAGASNGHVEGWGSQVSSVIAHAEGVGSYARGSNSHSEGVSTITNGAFSHIEGSNNIGTGEGTHIEGFGSITNAGIYSHAHGQGGEISSIASHVHGSNSKALGFASHAHGGGAIATGIAAHAHGFLSLSTVSAVGNYSHAHGSNAIAAGIATTATGFGTVNFASGNYTFLGGQFSRANGNNSFVYGISQTNDSTYPYMSLLGGTSNQTRLGGLVGVSSTTLTLVSPGKGATVCGGVYGFPRQNWSFANSGSMLSNIFGSVQTEWINLYCTTSTTNTYCNLIYLSNKADEPSPTSSNICSYIEGGRYYINVFEMQIIGYEKVRPSTAVGNGFFTANYRFTCYFDNTSTIADATRFRNWYLCDSDGNTISNNQTKSLSSINLLNKLSGTPSIDVRAFISTLVLSNGPNGQTTTALSIKSSDGLPINWYAQVKIGETFMNNVGSF